MKQIYHSQTRASWPTLWLALTLALILLVSAAAPAAAQSNITVQSNKLVQDFPNSITFTLKAETSDRITQVFLDYGTNAVTCVRAYGRIPVDVDPSSEVTAVWEWDFKDSGSLPAGSEVWWRWEIHTEDGASIQTDLQSTLIEDDRFSWKETGDMPLLLYHDTSASFAATLQRIGSEALAKMKDSFGISPSRPVKIILYNNADELREAALFLPEWVGGLAHPEYSILYIGVGDGETDWGTEVIYHEMAHLISGELTDNCLGVSMPTWLSEGFSVFMEDGPSDSEREDVIKDMGKGDLPALRTLAAGFSSNSYEATRSYAQSGMILRFLVDTYGGEKVTQLFTAIQDGQLIDEALSSVYGFNTDGLDAAWRQSLGFQAEPTPTPTAAPEGDPTLIPTLPLFDPDLPTAAPPPTLTPAPTKLAAADPTATTGAVPTATNQPSARPGLTCFGNNILMAGLLGMLLLPSALQRRKQENR